MSEPSVGKRVGAVIRTFLREQGRECPELSDQSDLHEHVGLTSDEGVVLAIEIGEAVGAELPDDFNATVHESGSRGRRFGELVSRVESIVQAERVS